MQAGGRNAAAADPDPVRHQWPQLEQLPAVQPLQEEDEAEELTV